MKIRHGLQKKISCIFEGGRTSSGSQNTTDTSLRPASVVQPSPAAASEAEKQRQADDQTGASGTVWEGLDTSSPDQGLKASGRPLPVPKQSTAYRADRQATMNLIGSVKGALFGGKIRGLDGHQKKMAILTGLLAAALVVVLVIVLNTGAPKVNAADKKNPQDEIAVVKTNLVYQWKQPQAFPASSRDPMKYSSQSRSGGDGNVSELIIRGIVYSDTNPTAIIAGQIVKQGQTVGGVKIIKINRDSVELEKDGKNWVQKVEK